MPTHHAVRVLIVDDSARFRSVARELLERRGYAVVGEADSASAAIRAVEVLAPDAALVDLELPDAPGSELASYLAVRHPAVMVLLTSADGDLDANALVEQTQAAGFAPKCELARVHLGQFWTKR
jgi:DNA-binding NarL/FixJ family response regulator